MFQTCVSRNDPKLTNLLQSQYIKYIVLYVCNRHNRVLCGQKTLFVCVAYIFVHVVKMD